MAETVTLKKTVVKPEHISDISDDVSRILDAHPPSYSSIAIAVHLDIKKAQHVEPDFYERLHDLCGEVWKFRKVATAQSIELLFSFGSPAFAAYHNRPDAKKYFKYRKV